MPSDVMPPATTEGRRGLAADAIRRDATTVTEGRRGLAADVLDRGGDHHHQCRRGLPADALCHRGGHHHQARRCLAATPSAMVRQHHQSQALTRCKRLRPGGTTITKGRRGNAADAPSWWRPPSPTTGAASLLTRSAMKAATTTTGRRCLAAGVLCMAASRSPKADQALPDTPFVTVAATMAAPAKRVGPCHLDHVRPPH